MPWSWNEAFGSTPGFWEQRCELLMLAVGPAWHPLPFPSSPCLGRLPAPPPLLPSLPPLPFTGTAKRIRIKRETCFSLASCSGPMTSPLQPPAPRFQPPSTFFPFDPPFYLNSTILYLTPEIAQFLFCFLSFFFFLNVHTVYLPYPSSHDMEWICTENQNIFKLVLIRR